MDTLAQHQSTQHQDSTDQHRTSTRTSTEHSTAGKLILQSNDKLLLKHFKFSARMNNDIEDDYNDSVDDFKGELGEDQRGGSSFNTDTSKTLLECMLNRDLDGMSKCMEHLNSHDNFDTISNIEIKSYHPLVLSKALEKYGFKSENGKFESTKSWINNKKKQLNMEEAFDSVNSKTGKKMLRYLDLIVNNVNNIERNNELVGGSTEMTQEEYLSTLNNIRNVLKREQNNIPVFMKQYLTDGNVEINHVLYNSDIQNGGSHNILNNLNKNLTGGSRK